MMMKSLRQVVKLPGTPVPLAAASTGLVKATIFALPANTTAVCIGDEGVRARAGEMRGAILNGGTRPDMITLDGVDLKDVFVDAQTADEGVTGFYQV